MIDTVEVSGLPLLQVGARTWGPERRSEPVRIGVPLPRGVVSTTTEIGLQDHDGRPRAMQARALDIWPDGSIRWALLDFLADVREGELPNLVLSPGTPPPTPGDSLHIATSDSGAVRIDTGQAVFGFAVGGAFPVSEVV